MRLYSYWFLPAGSHFTHPETKDRPEQWHRSGWSPEEFLERGYDVISFPQMHAGFGGFAAAHSKLLAKQNHVEIEPLCSPRPRVGRLLSKTPSSQKVGEVWRCPRLFHRIEDLKLCCGKPDNMRILLAESA